MTPPHLKICNTSEDNSHTGRHLSHLKTFIILEDTDHKWIHYSHLKTQIIYDTNHTWGHNSHWRTPFISENKSHLKTVITLEVTNQHHKRDSFPAFFLLATLGSKSMTAAVAEACTCKVSFLHVTVFLVSCSTTTIPQQLCGERNNS